MKKMIALAGIAFATVASAEWTPNMTFANAYNSTCNANGTATVTFNFVLSSRAPSPANLGYSVYTGDETSTSLLDSSLFTQVSAPQTITDGIYPDGPWNYTGHGADKTYSGTAVYTLPGQGTFTLELCATQPGNDHANKCDSQTVVLSCAAPSTDKCDTEARVFGQVTGNDNLCLANGTIVFAFGGDYGPTADVVVSGPITGNTTFTIANNKREGNSCNYHASFKPDASFGAGDYDFQIVGANETTRTYGPFNLKCNVRKK